MTRKTTNLWASALLVIAVLAAIGAAVQVGTGLRRSDSAGPLISAGLILAVVLVWASLLTALRLLLVNRRAARRDAPDPVALRARAQAELDEARRRLDELADPVARERLEREVETIRADASANAFRVVIFGTGSAGKTSLINALLGREAGAVAPTFGTTQTGIAFDHELRGLDARVILTDTPGLAEIGEPGAGRESEALDLATRADLLLFVVDHDLTRSELDALAKLARRGKRAVVALNKQDLFTPGDREAILASLRDRLSGIVPAEDVVAVAAAPRPIAVKIREPDGSEHVEWERDPPDLADLETRLQAVLRQEGEPLKASNLLLRARLADQSARDALAIERRTKAEASIEQHQWGTAAGVFANPIPALNLMAAGAVQFQMVDDIASAYGIALTPGQTRALGADLIQSMLRLSLADAATSILAGVFKTTVVGFAAGGAVQAVAMAYLTRIAGLALAEYFERQQSWGPGGIDAAVSRRFDTLARSSFLRDFARQAVARLSGRFAS